MRRFLLQFVCFLLAVPALAQNTLLNPPDTVDDIVFFKGAQALLANALPDNVQPTSDGRGIELAPGSVAGSLTINNISTRFPYNEAIPSWNGWAPPDGGFRVWMQPQLGGRQPASWFEAGTWGRLNDELTTRIMQFGYGWYNIDTLLLKRPATGVSVRIDLVRSSASSPSPRFYQFALSYTNSTGDSRLTRSFGYTARPVTSDVSLKIPYRSQVVSNKKWIGRICSPCSVAMALAYYGQKKDTQALAGELYDQASDAFGVWHRSVQGASQHGVGGYITRFRSWDQVADQLSRGAVISASIRFEPNEVHDPLRQFNMRKNGTQGHLVLITGLTADGRVFVHDTASKDHGVNSVWSQDELAKAWFDKGGVAYVFTGKL